MSHVITGENISKFRLATIIRALDFEIRTGMKMSHISALQAAKRDYPVVGRTKKQVLAELLAIQAESEGLDV